MPEKIECSAIHEQVDKIINSTALASKPQVRKLLRTLARGVDGKVALSSDRIIQELWPAEAQTKGRLDVAKEVSRLRAALETYYAGEGQADPLIIFLPNRSRPGPDGAPEKRWIAAERRVEVGPAEIARPKPPRWRRLNSALIATVAIICILAVGYLLSSLLRSDRCPVSARFDDTTLTVFNAEGKVLWRKNFPDGYSDKWDAIPKPWVGDLNGDGHLSVLFSYHTARDPELQSTILICYSDRGEEKWRWTAGRKIPELQGSPIGFTISGLAVLPPEHGRGPSRIAVSSWHHLYYPTQIAILDSQGKSISEYWHSGRLDHVTVADLDGDGRHEIIAAGVSNGYHQATLVVLDPDHLAGASQETARPEIQIHGMGIAHERLRLLFPRSDLSRDHSAYSWAQTPLIEHGRITVTVREDFKDPGSTIGYEFDTRFHLLGVETYDEFVTAHNEFYRTGNPHHSFTQTEAAEFQKVRCLEGCDTKYVAFSGGHAP
jgi:hypothetical protein